MLVRMWRVFRWSSDLVLLFTFSAVIYKSEGHNYPTDKSTDYLLCRGCGADIADASYIVNRFSPEALIQGNQTLFGQQSVAVQLLQNPLGIRFRVVILDKANCIGVGTVS
ncbi:hypothetical protein C0J52_11312 [Blattella germanica]|nr:hypothetical protein C0J52_11312 [Blattella germanica]